MTKGAAGNVKWEMEDGKWEIASKTLTHPDRCQPFTILHFPFAIVIAARLKKKPPRLGKLGYTRRGPEHY
jgi:hypothetical protein